MLPTLLAEHALRADQHAISAARESVRKAHAVIRQRLLVDRPSDTFARTKRIVEYDCALHTPMLSQISHKIDLYSGTRERLFLYCAYSLNGVHQRGRPQLKDMGKDNGRT